MELGQICFGNAPVGEFEIPRGEREMEEAFGKLTEATNVAAGGLATESYIYEFENDLFAIRPYYWGDCHCGFEENHNAWLESHPHGPECYQTRIKGLDISRKDKAKVASICQEMGLTYPEGAFVHCTCSRDADEMVWLAENSHAAGCRSILPNFLHKPSGYALSWYKYPFRSAYGNQEKSPEELAKIFAECLQSLQ